MDSPQHVDDSPTSAEVQLCTSILRRLSPDRLDEHPELTAAGESLFRRRIVTKAFGSEDAVAAVLERQSSQAAAKKQAHALNGKLQAIRAELTKLCNRQAKLSTNVTSELAHLHALLPKVGSGDSDAASTSLRTSGAARAAALLASTSVLTDPRAPPKGATALAAPPGAEQHPAVADPASAYFSSSAVSSNYAPNAICTDERFLARPIGRLHTCFVEKNGTPRQGCVCPSSVATLKLRLPKGLNAAHALEGLEAFSHVWVVFVFHLNGNAAAKSKVHPPRCDGAKYGLFATRTPHRPNPIGLSLVEVEAVRGDTLHLRGVDLVDGTPVLDIKPYVPFADGNLLREPTVAHWLVERPTQDLKVEFTQAALAELEALAPSLRLLGDAARARAALTEILVGDPRSVHWRKQRSDVEYGFSIDCLNVVVSFATEGLARVTQVQHLDLCDRSHLDGRAGTR